MQLSRSGVYARKGSTNIFFTDRIIKVNNTFAVLSNMPCTVLLLLPWVLLLSAVSRTCPRRNVPARSALYLFIYLFTCLCFRNSCRKFCTRSLHTDKRVLWRRGATIKLQHSRLFFFAPLSAKMSGVHARREWRGAGSGSPMKSSSSPARIYLFINLLKKNSAEELEPPKPEQSSERLKSLLFLSLFISAA